jgi:hypothetical protein
VPASFMGAEFCEEPVKVKAKAVGSFVTHVTDYTVTQHHISTEWNPQPHFCET